MGRRTFVLVLAILLAVFSAFAVWTYLSNVRSDAESDIELVTVFRVTELVEAGTGGQAVRDLVVASEENRKFLPANFIASQTELDSILDAAVAAGPISANQVLTTDMWIAPSELEAARLSESIATDRVAIAIQPSQLAAVGGYIRPGDKVNIIASTTLDVSNFLDFITSDELQALFEEAPSPTTTTLPPFPDAGPVGDEDTIDAGDVLAQTTPPQIAYTQTILQQIDVLAVGTAIREISPSTGLVPVGSEIIVLEVSVDDAEKIIFAQQNASLTFALVPEDYVPVQTDGVIIDDLFTLIERLQQTLEELEAQLGR